MTKISFEPKNIHIKDKDDFLNQYHKFEEMVFFQEKGNKVHIKISAPIFVKEVKELLKNVKD